MTHYRATFKISYDSPYALFTREHPDVTISQWCNWDKDYVAITSRSQIDREIQRDIQGLAKEFRVRVSRKSLTKNNMELVFDDCICYKLSSSPLMELDHFNCLALQPYVFQRGSELCRVVALSQADLRRLLSNLELHGKVEMLSKKKADGDVIRDSLLLSITEVLGALTSKQKIALRTALDIGYYKKPRGADASEVARAMGIPRTSFIDHVRKAENKVLSSLRSYITLEIK